MSAALSVLLLAAGLGPVLTVGILALTAYEARRDIVRSRP